MSREKLEQAKRKWKEKLAYFESQLAITAGAPQKFELQERIKECHEEINRIEAEPESLENNIDINQLQQDWLKWEKKKKGRIRSGIDLGFIHHINLVDSPLKKWWEKFLQTSKWHEIVEHSLIILQSESYSFPELSSLVELINNKIDITSNYESILTELELLFANDYKAKIETIIQILETTISELEEEIKILERKIKDLHKRTEDFAKDIYSSASKSKRNKKRNKKKTDQLIEYGKNIEDEKDKKHRIKEKLEITKDKLNSAINIYNELNKIQEIVQKPLFNKCFLVTGEIGSGKTNFILSLLGNRDIDNDKERDKYNKKYDNENLLYLVLEPNKDKEIENAILDEIKKNVNVSFENIEKLNSFLETEEVKLIIIIDELNEWLNLGREERDKLTCFIEENTSCHSIFWLITLLGPNAIIDDSIIYDPQFCWQRYSFIYPLLTNPEQYKNLEKSFDDFIPNYSGWVDLDELNVKNEVGIKLIKKTLELEGASDSLDWIEENWDWITKVSYYTNNYSEKNEKSERNSLVRYWSNPFIACILLDLIKRGTAIEKIVDLHFIEFITQFWNQRLAKLNVSPLYPDQKEVNNEITAREIIDHFTHFIAMFMARFGEVNPRKKDLMNYLEEKARERKDLLRSENIINPAIEVLKNGSLLKERKIKDSEFPSIDSDQILIRFYPFWEWRLAQELISINSIKEQNINDAQTDLEKWFNCVNLQPIKEGIFEFFLLLIYQIDDQTNFIVNLLRSVLKSKVLPSASIWISGSRANPKMQGKIAKLAENFSSDSFSLQHNIKEYEIRSYIYFVIQADPDAFQPYIRLKTLQRHYQNVKEYFLAEYYFYSIYKLFSRIKSNEIILKCMPYFSGCEVLEITPALAWLTVSVISQNINRISQNVSDSAELMLRDILIYLEQAETEDRPKKHEKEQEQCYFYWEWVLRFFCSRIVEIKRQNTFSFLDKNNWYHNKQLNINDNIGFVMKREANFALGYGYRAEWSGQEQRNFIKIIENLINSKSFTARHTAFFLIRHTKSTERKKGVKLDKRFQPFLREIFLDYRMGKIVKRYYKLFELNLDNIAQLEKLRQKNLFRKSR